MIGNTDGYPSARVPRSQMKPPPPSATAPKAPANVVSQTVFRDEAEYEYGVARRMTPGDEEYTVTHRDHRRGIMEGVYHHRRALGEDVILIRRTVQHTAFHQIGL